MSDNQNAQFQPDEMVGELSESDPVERAVFLALDEAAAKLDEQGEFDPFVVIVQGEEIHFEELDGEDEEAIYEAAGQTIFMMERLADAYIITYDGFVELDDGPSDAIIAEYARTGDVEAQVLAWLYERHGDHLHFTEPLYSIGTAPVLFSADLSGDTDDTTSADDGAIDQ